MATTSFVDPRRSRRAREANPIHLAIAAENYQMRHEVLTMDESLHGVRIRIAVPLVPGEKIAVFLKEGSQYRTPARVVWMRKAEVSEGYIAGLEFLKTLEPMKVPQFRRAS
jgi:hypothetical protein